jgi:hydroxyethylthiazole kinase-like uncharacterized protein yjeF
MKTFDQSELKKLYLPPETSHKGQNGKLLVIGGSHLFHAASLWALKVASRVVDMVFYSSVPENNEIVQKAKEEFRDGIVVPREELESYFYEADCVLIGPGMERNIPLVDSLGAVEYVKDIEKYADNEGEVTYFLTGLLMKKYPKKKWVIDAGALQMMEAKWLHQLENPAIITPHMGELGFLLLSDEREEKLITGKSTRQQAEQFAQKYNSIVLLKGEKDLVCSSSESLEIPGGNAGMTKGGTGDVLSGLVAALNTKNDSFLAACAGSYINKKAGESLAKRVGPFFNSSDLVDEIPKVMKNLLV